MTIRILNSAAVALSTAVLLSACGGGGDSAGGRAEDPSTQSQGLVYAYPSDNQSEVSTAAPVILRFSASVSAGDAMNGIRLYEGDADGREMTPNVEAVQGEPNNVMIVPADDDPFQPNQQYTVVIDDLRLTNGDTARDRTLQFTTRALHKGPKELVVTDMDDFNVIRTFPNFDNQTVADGERLAAMDFSSFRFQMSQPVDRGTAVYGESVTLTYGVDDEQVPATLLVDGRYLTVDPEPEHLDPSQNYTLTLTGDLASTYGANLTEERFRFRPLDTSPRGEPTELVQRLTVGGRSKLTGRDVNQVPVNGTLLGEDANVTQARAESVIAELGDATQFPETLPIRLPKGTVLNGDEINPILIGGEVPAGFGSGDVTMTLLSDATGYLMQNPYSDGGESGARMIKLMMDVGIATGEARANGAFTQDLLHIELVGMAEIDTDAGVLNVDAVSVVEPDILGQEFGYGLLSFQLQSYEDQLSAPTAREDSDPPVLQSWMPGQRSPEMPTDENGDAVSWFQQPDAPIVLNFDEPLDVESLNQPGALTLTKGGDNLDITYKVDGAAVVIRPEPGLQYSPADSNPEYTIQLGSQITDLAGNNLAPKTLTFRLPGEVTTRSAPDYSGDYSEEDVQVNSPVLLSAYPGYPCVTDPATRDLANGLVGRCAGGAGDWPSDYPLVSYQADDNLPLMSLPANQPIVLQFTKAIDPDSVQLGGSFNVVRVDSSGQPIDASGNPTADPRPVPGALTVEGQRITFVPEEPWVPGQYYKYVLGSNDYMGPAEDYPFSPQFIGSEDAVCGTRSICGKDGHPLRSQPLGVLSRTPITPQDNNGTFKIVADYMITNTYFIPGAGGPDMAIFFKGAVQSKDVLQTLRSSPDVDSNGNFIHDADTVTGKLSTLAGFTPPFYNTDPGVGPDTTLPDGTFPTVIYPFQEPTPSVPDPDADPAYDPSGVQGLPNSAKIFSINPEGSDLPWYAEGADLSADPVLGFQYSSLFSVDGANVGCSYDAAYDPVTGEPGFDPNDMQAVLDNIANSRFPKSEPTLCPEKKFTYVKMGLNATVTDEYVSGKGIKVLIWPSQAISTSFVSYARNAVAGAPTISVSSGEQIMRMRYAKDDPSCVDTQSNPCRRTQPITGWIKTASNGTPVLTAEVDLYLDAPFIGPSLSALGLRNNLHSYQVRMSLNGPVTFLDDGRMMVQQRNQNPIDIDFKIYSAQEESFLPIMGTAAGRIPYRIPENGVFLQMLSSPIK